MRTSELTGPDLDYWVARANMRGTPREAEVLRWQYGQTDRGDPATEPSKRQFVEQAFGPELPARSLWH